MHKLLIPLFACLFLSATSLFAQVPETVHVPYPIKPTPRALDQPEFICNNAGTYTLGQFTGQSNDTGLDTIYLCAGDNILINHNGDEDLSGDPQPVTPAGVGYFFYSCLPTIAGDNLQTIVTDPCIELDMLGLPYITTGDPNFNNTFFNDGITLQTLFGTPPGSPVVITFAPATIDDYATNTYESAQAGFPPGPCVNVNTQEAFQVVYLKPVNATGIDTSYDNNLCRGKFRLKGGLPEFDNNSSRYTVSITLSTDPSVHAIIQEPTPAQYKHNSDVIFSVPQPGVYTINIEDGKSCGYSFQMNMGFCDPSGSTAIILPEATTPPGSNICVPVTVNNYANAVGISFTVDWDETLLNFQGTQSVNPIFSGTDNFNFNTGNVAQGLLGAVQFNQNNNPVTLANGDTLFEICFNTLGQLGDCSPLYITNALTNINVTNEFGTSNSVVIDTGSICLALAPLSIQVSVVDTTCVGPASNASLQICAVGGTAPYEASWMMLPAGANPIATIVPQNGCHTTPLLPSGTYRVCVRDSNGIGTMVCDTVVINLPSLGASLDLSKLPSCNNDNNGMVTANVLVNNGIIVPDQFYTFTWNPNVGNTQSVDSLFAGSYAVTVTNTVTGCTATASGTLPDPAPVSEDQLQITPATCSGVCDGSISLTMEGGTPFPTGYNFSWEYSPDGIIAPTAIAGCGVSDSCVLTDLCAGFYYVTVTDKNGCTYVPPIEYVVGNLQTIDIALTGLQNTLCVGSSDGFISVQVNVTPADPNAQFQFFWTGACVGTQTGTNTTSTYDDLCAGDYMLLATNAAGCAANASYTIETPPALTLSVVSETNPTCPIPNGGAITVAGFGGAGGGPNAYTYLWPDSTTNASHSGLVEGSYTITVTDANGCTATVSDILQLPAPPVISNIIVTPVICGADGCLEAVTNAAGPTYLWADTTGDVGSTAKICNLQGGWYYITVIDNQGCSTNDSAFLQPVPGMVLSDTTLNNPSCFGYDDGSIIIGVTGGMPALGYAWSVPGAPSAPALIDQPAGDYSVTVTDSKGCTLVGDFTLTDPPAVAATFSNISGTTCSNTCDGTATVLAFYATTPQTPGDFSFQWNDGTSTDSVRTDLCGGLATVTVSDALGCFFEVSVEISSPPAVTGAITNTPVTCFGGDDGSATVTPTGGNGGAYTFQWSSASTAPTANNLTSGDYTVTITDNSGCTGTATTAITQPDEIMAVLNNATSSDISCYGETDGSLNVDVTGGNGGFTYTWYNNDAPNTPLATGNPLQNQGAGAYFVVIEDSKGCSDTSQAFLLTDPPKLQGSFLPLAPLVCFGDQTTLVVDTIFGGSGTDYQFILDFGLSYLPDYPVQIGGGTHYITYFDGVCELTDTIFVPEPEQIVVNFDPNELLIELGDSVLLEPIITGALVDSFVWMPTQYLTNGGSAIPAMAYTFSTQEFTLTVYDDKKCFGTGTVLVKVDPNRNVYIPNIFKAGNEEGRNDYFYPSTGKGVERINFMRIYDRWGNQLYERGAYAPDYSLVQGWDGRYRGDWVNPGVYVYVIEVKFLDGRVLLYRGDVTVIR